MNAAVNILAPTDYPVLSASELAATYSYDYAVKGLMPAKGVASIYGTTGAGKSFLTFDMAGSIAMGKRWFGYRTKQRRCLYLGLEAQSEFHKRWCAYTARHGSEVGQHMGFGVAPLDLGSSNAVDSVISTMNKLGFAGGVVFIDTLACAMPGLNENEAGTISLILANAKRIALEANALVVLVHHSGKDTNNGPRGSSAFSSGLDSVIEVKREGKTNNRSWVVAKVKDGLDGATHNFMLDVVELGYDDDGDIIDSCVIEGLGYVEKPPTGASGIALKALASVTTHQPTPADIADRYCLPSPHDLAKLSDWKAACIAQGISDAKNNDGITKAFNRAKEALANQDKVIISGEWVWLK